MISLLLRVIAFLCFLVLVFGQHVGSIRLLYLGFACWVLSELLTGVGPAASVVVVRRAPPTE